MFSRRVKKNIEGGGQVVIGGNSDDAQRYIAPTVLADVKFTDTIMQDEVHHVRALIRSMFVLASAIDRY